MCYDVTYIFITLFLSHFYVYIDRWHFLDCDKNDKQILLLYSKEQDFFFIKGTEVNGKSCPWIFAISFANAFLDFKVVNIEILNKEIWKLIKWRSAVEAIKYLTVDMYELNVVREHKCGKRAKNRHPVNIVPFWFLNIKWSKSKCQYMYHKNFILLINMLWFTHSNALEWSHYTTITSGILIRITYICICYY